MLDGLKAVPPEFGQVFDTLPQKGGEGGRNFSTASMTSITAGAPGAGTAFGNAADRNQSKAGDEIQQPR